MKQQTLSSMYWIVVAWVAVIGVAATWGCNSSSNNTQTQTDASQAPGSDMLVQVETPEATSEAAAPKPMLRIEVSGAKSKQGVYSIALFDNEENFKARTDSILSTKIPANEAEPAWEVNSLSQGTYAVAVFHDENENDKLDRHALGYPTEVYGFSNNARAKFGPPPFADAKFTFAEDDVEMRIEIK